MLPLLLLCPCAVAQAQPRVDVGSRVPAWVEPIEAPASHDRFEGAVEWLLRDTQWHLEARGATRFERLVYRVRTTAGVQGASEIGVPVGVGEELRWHYVRRTRDGQTVDLLDESRVRVFQPEAGLDEGVYDESREALTFLEDIRPGDVIDHAYSIVEASDHFGGRFAAREMLGRSAALRRLHVSATWPSERAIQVRVHGAPRGWTVEQASGRLRIDALGLPEAEDPGDAPTWWWPRPWVELSEYRSWAEVVEWAAPSYALTGETDLSSVPMDEIRAEPDPAAQLDRALRYVQDDVRYVGLEIGAGAFVPRPPELVAQRRYGDCKDKALLFVAILRALGIEAHAALVSTRWQHTLDDMLPSPLAFNHVIVRVELGNGQLWVDPTLEYQRGPAYALPQLDERRALVIGERETRPVAVPFGSGDESQVDVVEHYEVRGAGASLEATSLYRGALAEELRARVASSSIRELQEEYREFYADRGLELYASEPLRIEEVSGEDAIRIVERYHIDDFHRDRDVSGWAVLEQLDGVDPHRPRVPLALEYPMHVRHRVIVDDPDGWEIPREERQIEDPAFTFTRAVRVEGTRLILEYELRVTADHVAGEALERYDEHSESARHEAHYGITDLGPPPAGAAPGAGDWGVCGLCGGAGLCFGGLALAGVMMARWRSGSRKRSFAARQRFARGEAPESAIEVADLDEAKRTQPARECCGGLVEGAWSSARLGGSSLFVHTTTCPHCGESERRYYRAKAGAR